MKLIIKNNHYEVWNGVRYLGNIERIGNGTYVLVPSVIHGLYSAELKAIVERLDELNNMIHTDKLVSKII